MKRAPSVVGLGARWRSTPATLRSRLDRGLVAELTTNERSGSFTISETKLDELELLQRRIRVAQGEEPSYLLLSEGAIVNTFAYFCPTRSEK